MSVIKKIEDVTGNFKPKVTQTANNIKNGISNLSQGINETVTDIGKNVTGITGVGAALRSAYNMNKYQTDENEAAERLNSVMSSEPGQYKESSALIDLKGQLTEIEGQKPAEFNNKYQEQIDSLLNELTGQKPFSYDYTSDPTWQTLKDQYQRNAVLGMQSAMGEAAGLTGGYANSFAQQVGQQAYQQNISEMTDIIPELANNALNVWQANNNQLMSNLSALQSQQSADYSRFYNDWQLWSNDRNYMYQKVQDMSQDEFNKYLTELQRWQADRSYYTEQKQTAIANQQYQQQMNEERRQFNQQMLYNYANLGVNASIDLIGIGADTALGVADLVQNQQQFDASLAEDQRQFDAGLDFDYANLAEDKRQFNASLAEDQRQFDTKLNDSGDDSSGGVDEYTYNDVVGYLNSIGVEDTSTIMTKAEFDKIKNNPNSPAGVGIVHGQWSDYQTYLAYTIEKLGGVK